MLNASEIDKVSLTQLESPRYDIRSRMSRTIGSTVDKQVEALERFNRDENTTVKVTIAKLNRMTSLEMLRT